MRGRERERERESVSGTERSLKGAFEGVFAKIYTKMRCWAQYLWAFFVSFGATLDPAETHLAKTPFSRFLRERERVWFIDTFKGFSHGKLCLRLFAPVHVTGHASFLHCNHMAWCSLGLSPQVCGSSPAVVATSRWARGRKARAMGTRREGKPQTMWERNRRKTKTQAPMSQVTGLCQHLAPTIFRLLK